MTSDYVLVTTTVDSADGAESLAVSAVMARLAACAHVRELSSTYWWEGAVQHEREWEVAYKTPAHLAEQLQAFILERHTYDTPQVIVTPIIGGSPAYLQWLTAETTPR